MGKTARNPDPGRGGGDGGLVLPSKRRLHAKATPPHHHLRLLPARPHHQPRPSSPVSSSSPASASALPLRHKSGRGSDPTNQLMLARIHTRRDLVQTRPVVIAQSAAASPTARYSAAEEASPAIRSPPDSRRNSIGDCEPDAAPSWDGVRIGSWASAGDGGQRARAVQRGRAGVRDDHHHARQRRPGLHARRAARLLLERLLRRRGRRGSRVLHRPQPGVLRGAAGPAPHGQPPRAAAPPGEAPLPRGALLRPPRPRPRRAVGRFRRGPPPPGRVRARARTRGRHGHPRRARRRLLRRARRRRARVQLDARRAPPGLARPLAGQRRGLPRRRHAPDRGARAAGQVRRRHGRVLRRLRRAPPPLPRRARPAGQVLHRRCAGVRPGLEHLRQLQGPAQRVRHRRLGPRHRRAGRLLLRAPRLRTGRRRQAPVAGRHQRAHGGYAVPQGRQLFHRPAGLPGQGRGLVLVRRRRRRVARRQARAPRHRHGGRALRLRDQPVRRPRLPRPPERRRRRALELPQQADEPEGARRGELLPEARHARRAALLVDERQHLRVQRARVRADVDAPAEPRRRHL
uniref:Uncharacterized protein n=1 Tax=Setaria viridis TaxID=4556 RepID=A0A4U6U507_SETVI|nr:hypothetical protein SEVIR_7G164803v2 [Setaria viridis]